jgi:glycerol transport system ATP-binding protein
MARIEFIKVGHSYYGKSDNLEEYALQPMNLFWDNGEKYALLGPSGCGKTTLLNIISGLVHPSDGRVLFDGKDITDLPTAKRNIAQVFQFPVIYNTMSVYNNLAFPLRCRKLPSTEIDTNVKEVAKLLNLTHVLSKPGLGLTADAKQLISLGRGLVRNDVAAIMLDEPLTVVDPHLKWQLRRKLKEVNKAYKMTMILVTHDQNEAMTFADKVVLMRDGQIIQVGTPQELFENPQHTFTGYFIGSPAMNFMPCRLENNALMVKNTRIPFPGLENCRKKLDGTLKLGIRTEFLRLEATPSPDAVNVSIVDVRNLGSFSIVTVVLEGQELKVKVPIAQPLPKDRGYLSFPSKWTKLYHEDKLIEMSCPDK